MTWKDLANHIAVMDEEQSNTDVTIHLKGEDEYIRGSGMDFSPENDVLDKNHPFLVIDY
jgi:hypothetical protein